MLEPNTLNSLSLEVMSAQATLNVGLIGHVAHGKSTLVKALSGIHTVKFKAEMERNITIKLGYANAKIYKCDSCVKPGCYSAHGSNKVDKFACTNKGCKGTMILQRHISFVDCPGHDVLMATMLNGAAVMDGALLMIASNEECPQPQTLEHLAAVEIMKLEHIIIVQNKMDLITEEQALEQCKIIKEFVKGTKAENSPIVPISAQLRVNIDVICEYICNYIPIPKRNFMDETPRMMIVRSFDINKPGAKPNELLGGVAGGSIITGILRIGDEIEIRPGIVLGRNAITGQYQCQPLRTIITSLHSEKNILQYAVPGGLIGVGTKLDPDLCKSDKLIGQVLGHVGKLPDIYSQIEINFSLMKRIIGCKETPKNNEIKTKSKNKISKLLKDEKLMLNIGSVSVNCNVSGVKEDLARLILSSPVCTMEGEKIAISRAIESHWRLIGWGKITRGKPVEIINE